MTLRSQRASLVVGRSKRLRQKNLPEGEKPAEASGEVLAENLSPTLSEREMFLPYPEKTVIEADREKGERTVNKARSGTLSSPWRRVLVIIKSGTRGRARAMQGRKLLLHSEVQTRKRKSGEDVSSQRTSLSPVDETKMKSSVGRQSIGATRTMLWRGRQLDEV